MAAIRRRSEGSGEETIYHELYFPEEKDLSTGKYSIFLQRNAFSLEKGFDYTYVNKDYDIEIRVRYDLEWDGKIIEFCLSNASSGRMRIMRGFLLPGVLDRAVEHEVVVNFDKLDITDVKLDGKDLTELQEGTEIE
jgi:hypothetical protein